jgi:hypothetical protein
MGGVSTLETTMRAAVKGNTGQSIKQSERSGTAIGRMLQAWADSKRLKTDLLSSEVGHSESLIVEVNGSQPAVNPEGQGAEKEAQ